MAKLYTQVESPFHEGIIIPAIWDCSVLIFANNGISEKFFGSDPETFSQFDRAEFEFFAEGSTPVKGMTRPYFTRKPDNIYSEDPELWELFHVFSNNKIREDGTVKKKSLLYSCLTPCKKDTIFCKCDECGDNFVINPALVRYYKERDLTLPTIRCPKCIQKKKIANR